MKIKYYALPIAAIVALMAIGEPIRAALIDDQIVISAGDTYVFKTFLKNDDILIASDNGIVTLTGVVAGTARKLLAEMTVAALQGVRKVDNRLTVNGTELSANSDARINEKVEVALALHRSLGESQIEVSVENGVVTLRGIVSDQAKKDLATSFGEDVEGVKIVNNEMMVSSTWKASYNKDWIYIDDASITAQVGYVLLSQRSTGFLRARVETSNGVVTLHGKVKNPSERTLATLLANDIYGVVSVRNWLIVE